MAKLIDSKPIKAEDVREDQRFKDVVIDTINRLNESVYNAFNRDITFDENIKSEIRSFKLIEGTDIGTNITFKFTTIINNPRGLILTKIVEEAGSHIILSNPITVDWDSENNEITIFSISGLNFGQTYNVNFLIF
jgi:hypothetical protein